MTNEEKSNEIAQQSDFTTNARDIDIAFKAAMKMAEWKDKQYQPVDFILEYFEDDPSFICTVISVADDTWCENCEDFSKKCIYKLLDIKLKGANNDK